MTISPDQLSTDNQAGPTAADYNQFAAGVSSQPYSNVRGPAAQQVTNSEGQTSTVVPDSTTPEASVSSFNDIPLNQLISPQQAPSAWAITNPAEMVYVGPGDGMRVLSRQGVIGELASKWHIHAKEGQNVEQLVLAYAAKLAGMMPKTVAVQGSELMTPPTQGAVHGVEVEGPPGIIPPKTKTVGATPAEIASKLGLPPEYGKEPVTGIDVARKLGMTPRVGEDPIYAIAQRFGINTAANAKQITIPISQAAEQIRSQMTTPAQIKNLQQWLDNAGYFTQDQQLGASASYTPGNFDTATQQAVGALLQDTANQNAQGIHVTWADTLNQQTNQVNEQGGIQAVLKKAISKRVPQATESQLQSPAIAAFQAELGRAPTAAEMATFTTAFDAAQQTKYGQLAAGTPLYADQSGVVDMPGLASPTQAASQFGEQNNAPEFFGHKVLGAAQMLASAISSGQPLDAQSAPNAAAPAS